MQTEAAVEPEAASDFVSGEYALIDGGEEIRKLPKPEKYPPSPRLRGTYRYGQILPHELSALAPLIIDFYKEIGFKEAAETPGPFIQEIFEEMSKNPYSIIYACADENLVPQGYMWLRMDRNVLGQPFAVIEHDYVIPEHRGTLREARMHHQFIEYAIQVGERCGVQYTNTVVKTKRLEESRMKLGFKSVEIKMTFKGTAQDFRNQNPSFQKFGKYQEVE